MNKPTINNRVAQGFFHALAVMIAFTLFVTATHAQTTGGTVISNQAAAAYSDGNGNNFSTVSNTVTVTVANVSSLKITPDAGANPSVVAGQTNVAFKFKVENNGNFDDTVRFAPATSATTASQSLIATNATITNAFIDYNGNGILDGSDVSIFGNTAAAGVTTPVALTKNGGVAYVTVSCDRHRNCRSDCQHSARRRGRRISV